MKNIAIFASGSGTNAQRIIEYFENKKVVEVKLVLSNKPDAYVLTRAKNLGVPTMVFNRSDFYSSNIVVRKLQELKIDLVVLAGFLWLVPENLIKAYPSRIINIHPALLPKFGGKGMFGEHVHKAVIDAGEKYSGISIHYINEKYDKGDIIFQVKCEIIPSDTPESLAQKIHKLEYEHFPRVIEEVLGGESNPF